MCLWSSVRVSCVKRVCVCVCGLQCILVGLRVCLWSSVYVSWVESVFVEFSVC